MGSPFNRVDFQWAQIQYTIMSLQKTTKIENKLNAYIIT